MQYTATIETSVDVGVFFLRILSARQMKAVELTAAKNGMSFLRLMENAGSACARIIKDRLLDLPFKKQKVIILCGGGKNGGDGFVIARKLYESGYSVDVVLVFGKPKDTDSIEMMKMLKGLSVNIYDFGIDIKAMEERINNAGTIVDCIFGTGFYGQASENHTLVFERVNQSSADIVSIDIPSGLICNSGDKTEHFVKPKLTIAISSLKLVHVLKPAAKSCGEVVVADIGISEKFYSEWENDYLYTLNDEEVKNLLPPINLLAHKGTFGHALCVCGSRNMPGAAVIAANGCVYSGAGLVTAAFPDCAYAAISSKLTEPLLLPLDSNREGTLSTLSINQIIKASRKATAILIGCGLGNNKNIITIIEEIIKNIQCPIVLDADGINAVCGNLEIFKSANSPLILTPHPGEMSRLTGLSISGVQSNRVKIAENFAREHGVTLVLKGANTIVAQQNGNKTYVNSTGNPGLATGGSGDLLSGILVSFLAQGMTAWEASRAAVYIHGLTADIAVNELSYRGLTATACIKKLPSVLSRFEVLL